MFSGVASPGIAPSVRMVGQEATAMTGDVKYDQYESVHIFTFEMYTLFVEICRVPWG